MNPYYPKSFLVVFFFLSSLNLSAQVFTGKVADEETSDPLPFSNIVLYSVPDTTFITGTVTDEKGYFSLSVPQKEYLLQISMLGYQTQILTITSGEIGTIMLTPKEEMLEEIVVLGSSELFRMENNGITANIQATPLKNMGNLSEILAQMPFVLKTENSYTVLGKGTPIFYVNNRLIRNNDDLQRINSKDVKKVNVILNPGAEYDASVNAVIKIETLLPKGEGIGVDLSTYNRYNSEWYTQDKISLNYRTAGLDIFGSLEFADMSFPKKRTRTNSIETEQENITVITDTRDSDRWRFITPQGGFNYIINDNHSFGARYEFFNTLDNTAKYDMDTRVLIENEITQQLKTYNRGLLTEKSHYVNAYYNGQISSSFKIKLDMDYKTSDKKKDSEVNNVFEDDHEDIIKTYSTSNSDLYAAKLTFETPLKGGSLSYGTEGSRTINKQSFSVNENTGIPGVIPSNNEVYQNLLAVFLVYNKNIGKISTSVGVRYENIDSEYYQDDNLVQEQSKRYQRLFPSASIFYNGEKIQTELAYRNTVYRPSYDDLKSTTFYLSPYTYSSGNPLLMPTYTNSMTYMLRWEKFTFMAVYDWNRDYIVHAPQPYLDNSMLIKPFNIDKSNRLSFNINYSTTFGAWRPNCDISFVKDYIKLGNPEMKFNSPILSVNFRNNFNIKGWQFGVDIRANSKGHRAASYEEEISWSVNPYVNKNFFDERLRLNISGNDIFDTTNDKLTYRYNGLTTTWDNYVYRRSIVLSFNYRFNIDQNRYKGTRSTNELNRL